MSIIWPHLEKILPGAAQTFARHGRRTLGELSRALTAPGPPPSPVLRRGVFQLTDKAYGPAAAARAEAALAAGRPMLTATHHGFETHPEMIQGGLFFSLADILAAAEGRPVPPLIALAGALVPLNNPTCPGGWLLGRRGPDGRPLRRFVFPKAESNLQAARASALTRARLEDAGLKIEKSAWRPAEKQAVQILLEKFLLTPAFLDRPDFLAQATWLASALWAARLPGPGYPELIHLEYEAVAEACLLDDLARPDSPLGRLLAEPQLGRRLLNALAGQRGCWSPRLLAPDLTATDLIDTRQPLGTALFWEINARGRRHSLGLPYQAGAERRLLGPTTDLPLAPEALAEALTRGLIKPGLFLSCLTFAHHGLTSYGGVFMIDYQPAMLRTAAAILETPLKFNYRADDFRLAAGPLAVGLTDPASGSAYPAGALEFLKAGPLPGDFFRRWADLRLEDIRSFSAGAWYQEEVPLTQRTPGWAEELPGQPPLARP